MINHKSARRGERGAALLEFAICATVFLTVMFGVIEFGRLLWTHNALTDAARRGARYAVNHTKGTLDNDAVRNVVVYGDPGGSDKPMIDNLRTTDVFVSHSADYQLGAGTVTVSIGNPNVAGDGYKFDFVVPLIGTTLQMPDYSTTLTGENVGLVPSNL